MSRSWVDIDHEAIAHNVALLAGRVGTGGSALCAVVKANAYGHGAPEVARTALDAGASWLAVAHAAEGRQLRDAGLDAPILLLSEPVGAAEVRELVAGSLRATVYSPEGVDALAATGSSLDVHLKVDTGMGRVGADPADAVMLARRIARSPRLRLEGLWTHCAMSDDPDNPFTAVQFERFDDIVRSLRDAGFEVPLRHVANTGAVLARTGDRYELVRPGISLYGVAPSAALAGRADLRPALRWASEVSLVKRVSAGTGISYGHRFRAASETVVATVPVGYADGLPRSWGAAGGVVLIGGVRRPIVGSVTMDQVMVDCGPDATVCRGDEVVLLGRQGDAAIGVEEIAAATGTIVYEILTGVGARVQRRHRGQLAGSPAPRAQDSEA